MFEYVLWYERNLRGKIWIFFEGRVRKPGPWTRPAGQQKTTRGSCWPNPQVTPFLLVVIRPDLGAFDRVLTRPDPIHEI